MAQESLTEQEVLQRLGIMAELLERLISEGRLEPVEVDGARRYDPASIVALEQAIEGQGDEEHAFIGYEETLQELQINRDELRTLVERGSLFEYRFGDKAKYNLNEVRQLESSPEKRPTVMTTAESEQRESEEGAEDVPQLDLEKAAEPEPEDEEFFDFTEELMGESEAAPVQEAPVTEGAEAFVTEGTIELEVELPEEGIGEEAAADEAIAEFFETEERTEREAALEEEAISELLEEELSEKPISEAESLMEELSSEPAGETAEPRGEMAPGMPEEEEEMVTEILQLSGEEDEEEDLLGDILEMGQEEEETGAVEETAEPTGDITDEVPTTDDLTAEITELAEETYAADELEEAFADEEEVPLAEIAEEIEVPRGEVVMGEPAVLIGTPMALVLLITLIILAFGALFAIENAGNPAYTSRIVDLLSIF